jgi:hypothetical protein
MPEKNDGTDRPKHWGKKKQSNADQSHPDNNPPPGKSTSARADSKRKKK